MVAGRWNRGKCFCMGTSMVMVGAEHALVVTNCPLINALIITVQIPFTYIIISFVISYYRRPVKITLLELLGE